VAGIWRWVVIGAVLGAPGWVRAETGGVVNTPQTNDWFWQSSYLLGDVWGGRDYLQSQGVGLQLANTTDLSAVVSGGRSLGSGFASLTQATLTIDTAKAIGWEGGRVNVSGLWILGAGITGPHVGAINPLTDTEATTALRLFEAYYEQNFWGKMVSVRVGQLAADQEFLTTDAGELLVNGSFDWPTLATSDLPAGGAAYPLGTPGVRVAVTPMDGLVVRTGVFNGNPAPQGIGDPQRLDPSGTSFRLNGGVFAIAEVEADQSLCLAHAGWVATCKLGAWYENHAVSAVGGGRIFWSDWSVYGSVEREIWHLPGVGRPVSAMLRVMGAPGDRNEVNFAGNAAVTVKGIWNWRADDWAGVGGGVTQIARGVVVQDVMEDAKIEHGSEEFVEATYQAVVTPWWNVQPDIQYVVTPGGEPRAKNAVVVFVRSLVTF